MKTKQDVVEFKSTYNEVIIVVLLAALDVITL